jgi:hypothetical protein
VRQAEGKLQTTWIDPPAGKVDPADPPGQAQAAAGTVLEVALPFAHFGVRPGEAMTFFVTVQDVTQAEVERHPTYRPIELTVPDDQFEARNWTV